MYKEVELLGRRVTFCRLKTDPATMKTEPHEGEGVIVGIFLSVDQRAQVRVMEGANIYNIDLPAINATPAGKQKYYDHISATHRLSEQGSDECKSLANQFNKQIEQMNFEYLGPPIKIQTEEPDDSAPAQAVAQ